MLMLLFLDHSIPGNNHQYRCTGKQGICFNNAKNKAKLLITEAGDRTITTAKRDVLSGG